MRINYDFYTGRDNYSEGDIEKDVILYLEKYGENGYGEVFKKDLRWSVFYHITPIRKNIINWYPFKENSSVLEIGAGMGAITGVLCDRAAQVTSVELSKQRAMAIQARCGNRDNLELILGNFNDIKFERKFDYITLIGVLEYAPLYTGTNNPYYDFLNGIKELLNPGGKLLIAIENQFGMKYFSGAPEDHIGKMFEGIIGYNNKKGVRTFGKQEISNILKQSGFEFIKFYYPLPDYKMPNIIFSDDYMPDENTINEYLPYLSEETSVLFDEKLAYCDIIKNGMFSFFANSFFIEASTEEIDTNVDLEKQKLIAPDLHLLEFYNRHYSIKTPDQANKMLLECQTQLQSLACENERLKREIEGIINSKSWKITGPLRALMRKIKG